MPLTKPEKAKSLTLDSDKVTRSIVGWVIERDIARRDPVDRVARVGYGMVFVLPCQTCLRDCSRQCISCSTARSERECPLDRRN